MMFLDRKSLEERERNTLAPYAARSGDTEGRVHPEKEHALRTAYQRDRDRIIHSIAFRRLEYKTHVFINHEGDHYRTRLTHTLEVAQISGTIARTLGLNEDLAEAIALAHDVGHTPFGHAGEDALRELMSHNGGFEHNLHGLRVVDLLEGYNPDFPGLNLTYELREAIAKHKTRWDTPVTAQFGSEQPVLEAQVVEAADSIAYDNHDLDDGMRAGILVEGVWDPPELWSEAEKGVAGRWPGISAYFRRRQIVRYLINIAVCDLIDSTKAEIEKRCISSLGDVRRQSTPIVCHSPDMMRKKEELEDLLFRLLYRNEHVMKTMGEAKGFILGLFNAYVKDPALLPEFYRTWAERVGRERAVCDYVAGMTDRYAQEQYLKLAEA